MTRLYEKSHPWLTFKVDFAKASNYLWLLLGEAQSKCRHIEGVPLQPETAAKLLQLYLVKGARASAAIEGNTLSEEQALLLASGEDLDLPPSQEYLQNELDNIFGATNQLVHDIAESGPAEITTTMIQDFNRRILKNLEVDPGTVPGEFRLGSVAVGPYVGVPAEDCEYLVERLCEWLSGPDFHPPAGYEEDMNVVYGVLKAIMAHLYLAWIHPFGDGNGRTARLMEVQILVSVGVPQPAAHLLSNYYNETRSEYYRQLDKSSKVDDGHITFATYAVRGFVEQLRSQLLHIREQQWNGAWINHVHAVLHKEKGPTGKRRRDLVLELSKTEQIVPKGQIPNLSLELAQAYLGKTAKTLTRDLNFLVNKDLVQRVEGQGFRARSEKIRAFLPWKATP